MLPSEVKTQIAKIKSSMKLEKICIDAYQKHRDEKNYHERMVKQSAIVKEATEVMNVIQQEYDEALDKIAASKRRLRFKIKNLNLLINRAKIEQFKQSIRELAKISKEIDNDEEHSNA